MKNIRAVNLLKQARINEGLSEAWSKHQDKIKTAAALMATGVGAAALVQYNPEIKKNATELLADMKSNFKSGKQIGKKFAQNVESKIDHFFPNLKDKLIEKDPNNPNFIK